MKTDYKKQLMMTFQEGGFQNQMKKQMRVKILQKLKHPHINLKQQSSSFLKRVISSLISENLLKNNYLYSNSVYLPQCGYQNKTLIRQELITLMNIKQQTIEKQTSLLEYIIRMYVPIMERDSLNLNSMAIQTDPEEIGYTLRQRQAMIQRKYINKTGNERTIGIDQQTLRRQIQIQLKQHYEKQMRRFRQFQIENVKLEQGQKIRRKFQSYTRQIQQKYRRKLDDLRKRQKKIFQQEDKNKREFEHKKQSNEDLLKRQTQLLELRKKQVQEQNKLQFFEKQLDKDKINALQQQLRNKIKQYDTLNLRANQKINYQVNITKLAIQKDYQDKQIQFMQRKKKVDQEYYKMMAIKDSVQIIQKQNSRMLKQNEQIRNQLKEALSQIHNLVDESKMQTNKLQSVIDQKKQIQKELQLLKKKNTNQNNKINKLQHELTHTRQQLDHIRRIDQQKQKQEEQQRQLDITPIPIDKKVSSADQLHTKMMQLRRNRKKQIEKLKLELLAQ